MSALWVPPCPKKWKIIIFIFPQPIKEKKNGKRAKIVKKKTNKLLKFLFVFWAWNMMNEACDSATLKN